MAGGSLAAAPPNPARNCKIARAKRGIAREARDRRACTLYIYPGASPPAWRAATAVVGSDRAEIAAPLTRTV